jgi:hypothetical protein
MGVSYVVTVYNKAAYLAGVLNSIAVEQADTGGEIVIVDDGSTDGSPALIADFARGRRDVTIIAQENSGVAAATNKGVAAAKELYLRLVDGDDRLVVGSTRHLIDAVTQTGCGFAFGRFAGVASPPQIHVVADPLRRMLQRQPFVPASTLGLTAVIQQALPLSPRFKTAQDFALGIKLARLTGFAETSALCCIQPATATGLSADKARMFQETVLIALALGQEQQWPAVYRRLAIARNAGRARNYLRRHGTGGPLQAAGVSFLAIAARIPVFWPYKRLMTYIANAYNPPL